MRAPFVFNQNDGPLGAASLNCRHATFLRDWSPKDASKSRMATSRRPIAITWVPGRRAATSKARARSAAARSSSATTTLGSTASTMRRTRRAHRAGSRASCGQDSALNTYPGLHPKASSAFEAASPSTPSSAHPPAASAGPGNPLRSITSARRSPDHGTESAPGHAVSASASSARARASWTARIRWARSASP